MTRNVVTLTLGTESCSQVYKTCVLYARPISAGYNHAVRNNIIEGVLVADPILKAVHAGKNASPAEQQVRFPEGEFQI